MLSICTPLTYLIYVNEQLTEDTRDLLAHTEKLRDDGTIKFIWVKDGTVFIREDEDKKAIKIRPQEELESLFNSNQNQVGVDNGTSPSTISTKGIPTYLTRT